jgi:hypothetical protein
MNWIHAFKNPTAVLAYSAYGTYWKQKRVNILTYFCSLLGPR